LATEQQNLNALPFFRNIKNVLTAGGTGGLTWHVHAALSGERWSVTKEYIEAQLFKGLELHAKQSKTIDNTLKATRSLVLIGASAGWMMSSRWLEEFSEIDVYDIDPLSPVLFMLNHGRGLRKKGIKVSFYTQDAIDQLDRVLLKHPKSLIWFDNVLGQHRIRLKDSELASTQLKILQRRLKGRFWGSVHDLYSGPVQRGAKSQNADSPGAQTTFKTVQLLRLNDSEADSARVHMNEQEMSLGSARQKFLQTLGATPAAGAWLDHETSSVFPPNTPLTWMGWDFRPNYCHCLELGWTGGA